jgi:hypothetical protein
MTGPGDRSKISLDALIAAVLRSSVAGMEPSPCVWQRIEKIVRRQIGQTADRFEADLHPQNLCRPVLQP